MSNQESIQDELKEKHKQLREQYAGEMKSLFQKQKEQYINFFKYCPPSGRYAGVLVLGILIGMMI